MNDNLTFGLTMLLVGMGGTLLTLFLVTLLIRGLVAIFPLRREKSEKSD
jgi:hypothetical protein